MLEQGLEFEIWKDLNYKGMEATDNNRDLIGNIKRRIAWTFISKDYDFSHRK